MLKDCLTQFGNSITQVATQIKSIPEQIASLTQTQITNIASEFSAAAQLTLDTVTSTQINNGIPDAVTLAFNQPAETHSDVVQQYITDNTPSTDDLKANTTGSKMANMGRP